MHTVWTFDRKSRFYLRLKFLAESLDGKSHRPGGGFAKRADRATFDIEGYIMQKIDVFFTSLSCFKASKDLEQPTCAFAAWCALSAGLVPVKLSDARENLDNIRILVHHHNAIVRQNNL